MPVVVGPIENIVLLVLFILVGLIFWYVSTTSEWSEVPERSFVVPLVSLLFSIVFAASTLTVFLTLQCVPTLIMVGATGYMLVTTQSSFAEAVRQVRMDQRVKTIKSEEQFRERQKRPVVSSEKQGEHLADQATQATQASPAVQVVQDLLVVAPPVSEDMKAQTEGENGGDLGDSTPTT